MLLVLAAAFFAAGCGSAEGSAGNVETLVVRVSGTDGVPYFGSYGAFGEGRERVEGALGPDPVRYEVPVGEHGADEPVISATFMKEAARGRIVLEMLWNGEVVEWGATTANEGVVTLHYDPLP